MEVSQAAIPNPPPNRSIFHLAFPVLDLQQTKVFYQQGLGCTLGRESPVSLVLDFFGHQLVAHLTTEPLPPPAGIYPRHFGLVLPSQEAWEALGQHLQRQGIAFYQAPRVRFPGTPLEHGTFFLTDPSHNLLEFKFYTHEEAIFGAREFPLVGDQPSVVY